MARRRRRRGAPLARRSVRRSTRRKLSRKQYIQDSPRRKPVVALAKIIKPEVIRQTPHVLRTSRLVVYPQIIPRKPKVIRNTLRAELHPQECRARKQYKKTMLKKIAAQKKSGSGLKAWRKTRRLKTESQSQYRC